MLLDFRDPSRGDLSDLSLNAFGDLELFVDLSDLSLGVLGDLALFGDLSLLGGFSDFSLDAFVALLGDLEMGLSLFGDFCFGLLAFSFRAFGDLALSAAFGALSPCVFLDLSSTCVFRCLSSSCETVTGLGWFSIFFLVFTFFTIGLPLPSDPLDLDRSFVEDDLPDF